MQALGQLRYGNAVQALSDQFSYHQKGPDAMAALEGLAGIGHAISVSVFEDLLASSNAGMRRLAVEGLARAGNRDALPALQQLGRNERSPDVLLALHYANVKLGEVDGSLPQIVASLGNTSQRLIAVGYVLDVSTSVALRLAGSLKDPNIDIRRLVADAIGFSRNPAVIPALEAAAKDTDPDVAAAAQQAIQRYQHSGAAKWPATRTSAAAARLSTPDRHLTSQPICSAKFSCTAPVPVSLPASSSKSRRTSANPIRLVTPLQALPNGTRPCTDHPDTPMST